MLFPRFFLFWLLLLLLLLLLACNQSWGAETEADIFIVSCSRPPPPPPPPLLSHCFLLLHPRLLLPGTSPLPWCMALASWLRVLDRMALTCWLKVLDRMSLTCWLRVLDRMSLTCWLKITRKGKIPSTGKIKILPRRGSNPRRCSSKTLSPTHYQ